MAKKRTKKAKIEDIDAQLRGIKLTDSAEKKQAKNALYDAKELDKKKTDHVWLTDGAKTQVLAHPNKINEYIVKGFKILKK